MTPHILLDGAHNAEGIKALHRYIESIQSHYSSLTTIFATTKSAEHLQEFAHLLIRGEKNFVVHTATFNKKYSTQLPFAVEEFTNMDEVVQYLQEVKE